MSRTLSTALVLLLGGCQIEDLYLYPDGGGPAEPRADAAGPDAGRADAGRPDSGRSERPINSGSDVLALFEGKSLLMDAAHVPSHPNGYDENINFGQASQCIHSVRMDVSGGAMTVTTELARLDGAPESGQSGTCQRDIPAGGNVVFNTTAVLIENVRDDGGCFDITLTYSGFGQEGRGTVSADRRTVTLELFFRDQALGHRCAAGDVGSPTVTLNQEPFMGDAVQVYTLL